MGTDPFDEQMRASASLSLDVRGTFGPDPNELDPRDSEAARLAALYRYGVLDTESERIFDDLIALAAQICETPIALVSLVDEDRQWFKARLGLDVCSTPREMAFCAHALASTAVLEVEDAVLDPRFADNPLVTDEPHIRFYAGAPLITSDNYTLGTLCVIDTSPRQLTPEQRTALVALAAQVVSQLELRRQSHALAEELAAHEMTRAKLAVAAEAALIQGAFTTAVLESIDVGVIACGPSGDLTFVNRTGHTLLGSDGCSEDEPPQVNAFCSLLEGDGITGLPPEQFPLLRALREGAVGDTEIVLAAHDGRRTRVVCSAQPLIAGDGRLLGGVIAMHDITESSERERQQAKIAAHLEAVLRSATEHSVIATDERGLILTFNEGAERMLGYQASEIVGRATPALLHDPDEVAHRASELGIVEGFEVFVTAARRGEVECREWSYIRRDGSRIPVRLTVTAMTGQDGAVVGFIGIAIDVSAEKTAVSAWQDELHRATANEARYRALVDHLPDTAAYVYDRDHRIVVATGAAIIERGFDPEHLLGCSPSEVLVSEDALWLDRKISQAFEGGGTTEELHLVTTGIDNLIDIVPLILDEGGGVDEVLVVARDIGPIKARERSIAASVQRWQAAFDDAPVGIVEAEITGEIIHANMALARFLETPPGDFEGKTIYDFLHPDEWNDVRTRVEAATLGGASISTAERRMVTGKGNDRWAKVQRAMLHDYEGTPNRLLVHCTDITERVEAEEAVRRARDEAMTATRFKSQFLANMSHEIRTPMNGILGMAELLSYSDLAEEQKVQLCALRDSGEHLLHIINDILDYSKVEAGKLELEYVDFNLQELVEGVHAMLFPLAAEKRLSFSLTYEETLPKWVSGDPGRLRQVLTNLVGNAIKFTEQGGVKVAVQGGSDHFVSFEVTDSGVGIPSDQQKAIMDPFAQADVSTTRKFGGTGLGLSICYQLVELMGGELLCDSQAAAGSTFRFEANLRESVAPSHGSSNSARPLSSEFCVIDRRALIVEDGTINQIVASRMLEHLGYAVDVVDTGGAAVELFKHQHNYDLVLMDVLMPDMDGYQATATIRSLEGDERHTPIVGLTASAMTGDRGKCLASGMDDYVSKPVSLMSLSAALVRCGAVEGRGPLTSTLALL